MIEPWLNEYLQGTTTSQGCASQQQARKSSFSTGCVAGIGTASKIGLVRRTEGAPIFFLL